MNAVTTVAKLVPIIAFIVLVAFLGFSWDRFTLDFWGSNLPFGEQLKGIMLYTVWVFIGIEGAAVYSQRAAKRSDVGRATVLGFLGVLALLLLRPYANAVVYVVAIALAFGGMGIALFI